MLYGQYRLPPLQRRQLTLHEALIEGQLCHGGGILPRALLGDYLRHVVGHIVQTLLQAQQLQCFIAKAQQGQQHGNEAHRLHADAAAHGVRAGK
uniref:FAD/NAD(P)-binding protein n=1 Tax=Aeromonas hydrophila TaxID=644 RepID=UPI003977814A